MPSQLVKCAFGFRSFNAPKTKCVPLSVELGSEQGGTCPRCPPMSRALITLADDGCNTATESSQTNRILHVFHSCYFHYSEYPVRLVVQCGDDAMRNI